jgi:cytochrome c553
MKNSSRSGLRRLPSGRLVLLLTVSILCQCFTSLASAAEKLQFNRDIRPILSDRCFKCHGPDKASRKVSLRLDRAEEAYAERKKSRLPAISPGKPDHSLVCRKIFSTDPDDQMPPPESNLSLSQAEKEKIRQWIAEGGEYQPHWAFIPLPDSVPVPAVKNIRWPRNEIDRFILARLEKEGLEPSAEADRTGWLRRVSFDLTGLPPTLEEVDSFLSDKSPAANEKVVDRLLASPHFGERLAVPWLDAARYADSYGYQSDQLCPTWPYRDWVVDAFNRNLPYDRFLTEQLAGDLLPNATREQRLATVFNRLHRQTNEGGSIEEEFRTEYTSDRVHTFSTATLALTFECAHCHDHKYDPITQRDYYSLFAFFNSIDEYGLYNDTAHVPTPSLLLPTPDQEKTMTATAEMLKEKQARLAQAEASLDTDLRNWLQQPPLSAEIPGLEAQFDFDALAGTNQFADALNRTNFSSALHGNVLVPGRSGQAVKFDGDDELAFPSSAGGLEPWEPYTVVFWLKLPANLTNGVIFHRCEGTDTGFHGTELSLEDGRLFFVLKRFWPGNALAIRSRETVPRERWILLAVSYDGSARARGMQLYLDGQLAPSEIVRDHLTKGPENSKTGFSFGALFRSTGLKDALLDDLRFYSRPLAPIEVGQLFDGHSLNDAVAARRADALKPFYAAALSSSVAQARTELTNAVKAYFEARNSVVEASVMEELSELRPAYVLTRGRYDAPKTEDKRVTRATPAVLPPFPANAPKNRLGLAAWLTDPHHPLTARVAVNRFWQVLFGRGLVATPENFGAQGAEPTHPELLDWLARDFVNSGWDTKALLKRIVLSATYRQQSKLRLDLRQRDPENLLLARGPSQRLPAEMIRDAALAASGLLDERLGGPPVSPYMPGDLWRESNSMSPAYHQSVGGDLYRRSLYTVWKRTAPMPDMLAFDAPSREVCVVRRGATATPQQAFVLLNDVQFVEAARVLAEKALAKGGGSDEGIRFVFRRLTSRTPSDAEAKLLADELREQEEVFKQEPERAKKLLAVGERKCNSEFATSQLAAMTEVAQTVMNLDATVWKR